MSQEKAVRTKWILLVILCALAIGLLVSLAAVIINKKSSPAVSSYADCVKARGAKILQTYPEVCLVDGKNFTNSDPKTTQATTPTTDTTKPKTDEELIQAAYATKNPCSANDAIKVMVKKITANGWAEVSAGCEPGSGHIEVWHKINNTWTYVIGFQEGPFCTMVVDNQISHELYATCITTEAGPTSSNDANGNPTIPNQIP